MTICLRRTKKEKANTKPKQQQTSNSNTIMAKTKKATKGGSKRQKPFPFDEYLAPFLVIGVAVLGYQLFRGMLAKEIVKHTERKGIASGREMHAIIDYTGGIQTRNYSPAVVLYKAIEQKIRNLWNRNKIFILGICLLYDTLCSTCIFVF